MEVFGAQMRLQKRRVVVAGHEANFLAVFLVVSLEAHLFRQRARLWLGQSAERQDGGGELFLAQAEEEVGLVLACVDGLEQ